MSYTYVQEEIAKIPKAGYNLSNLSAHQKEHINTITNDMMNAVNHGLDVGEVVKLPIFLGLLKEKSGLSLEQIWKCEEMICQECLYAVSLDDNVIDAFILKMRQHLNLPPLQ